MSQPDTSVRTCDHLREDGVFCNSPALRGRNYCYFHLNLRGRRLKAARSRSLGPSQAISLPFPEDMHAVQISLFEVISGLAANSLDTKRAGLLLYALQQAANNLVHTPEWHGRCQQPEPQQPLRALEFPAFEEQYQVPRGIDLEADPEVALEEVEGVAPHCLPSDDVAHNSQPLGTVGSQTDQKKKRKHRRRADRVPPAKPKGLWQHRDPDAPFRAYTSDGRELTTEDAKRWQQRKLDEMMAFIKYGDGHVPLTPGDERMDVDVFLGITDAKDVA
jgi:hypothetical protein